MAATSGGLRAFRASMLDRSAPNTLGVRAHQAWFGAEDGSRGLELYRLDLSNTDRLFANGFEQAHPALPGIAAAGAADGRSRLRIP
jgi:hypothetical protein